MGCLEIPLDPVKPVRARQLLSADSCEPPMWAVGRLQSSRVIWRDAGEMMEQCRCDIDAAVGQTKRTAKKKPNADINIKNYSAYLQTHFVRTSRLPYVMDSQPRQGVVSRPRPR